jgi:hypothetical protein
MACGLGWCWTKRLYDALSARTIPILSGSDIVMPFEKFINWEAISVKVTSDTWHNTSKGRELDNFRKKLRYESDLFRQRLHSLYESIGINSDMRGGIEHKMKPQYIELAKTFQNRWANPAQLLHEFEETLIWKKMTNIHKVFRWFYFNNTEDRNIPWKHPFKLIQLEMWCQVTTFEQRRKIHNHSKSSDLCLNSPNHVAEAEYIRKRH